MPKRKRPEEDPKEQFKRFVETAREVGVDQSDAKKHFGRLARKPKPPKDTKPDRS